MSEPLLTIVAPVYNEEQSVGTFLIELMKTLHGLDGRYRSSVLLVVDRSEDRTLEIVRDAATGDPRIKILALSSRFGHQMSLLAGIDHAGPGVVITMDSDLEHPPAVIPRLLERYEAGYDVVQAVRSPTAGSPFAKRLLSQGFYRVINRLSDVPIAESGADFRLMSPRVVLVFREMIRERNQFIRGLVSWIGFQHCHVAYEAGRRSGGSTKYSFGKMVRLAVDGIVSFSRRPLQAAVYVGLLMALAGFGYGIFIAVSYFFSSKLPPGWATLSLLITFFSGVQLIFLGVIGEYIGTIFDEVKGRPHYIVDEAINLEVVDWPRAEHSLRTTRDDAGASLAR